MTARRFLLALFTAGLLAPAAFAASDGLFTSGSAASEINVFAVGGYKKLESKWKPADDQREFGLQMDFRPTDWWANLAVGFLYGNSPEEQVVIPSGGTVTSESQTAELDLGLRKYFMRDSAWRPFLGGGLAVLRGESETRGPVSSTSDSGMGAGFWVGGGTLYLFHRLAVGAQAQYTQGRVKVFGERLDAGGVHVDGLIGVTF